jgi:hypothetical protein
MLSALLVYLVVASAPSSPPKDNAHSQTATSATQKQQQNSNHPTSTIKELSDTESADHATNNDAGKKQCKLSEWGAVEWSAVVQAICAAFIVAFTLVLLIYSIKGWEVAKVTADTAMASVDAMRLDQRAWVGIQGSSDGELKGKGYARINLVIVNSGRTPALNVDFCSRMEYVPGIPEENNKPQLFSKDRDFAEDCNPLSHGLDTTPGVLTFQTSIPGEPRHIGVIHPGQRISMLVRGTGLEHPGWGLTEKEVGKIESGESAFLYIMVRVVYSDIFDLKRRHNMLYTAIWRPLMLRSGTTDELIPCNFGNHSD